MIESLANIYTILSAIYNIIDASFDNRQLKKHIDVTM